MREDGTLEKAIPKVLYGLGCAAATVIAIGIGVLPHVGFSLGGIFVCGMAVCLPIAAAVALQVRRETEAPEKVRIAKRLLLATFSIYIILLAGLLFLSGGRFYFSQSGQPFWESLRWSVNLMPGKTIHQYITGFMGGSFPMALAAGNLLGNFFLFAPMGVLLPCLSVKFRKWRVFAPVMLGVLILVEVGQLLLRVGMCDIDDVILNFSGACLFFSLWRTATVRRLLRKLYLLGPEERQEPEEI